MAVKKIKIMKSWEENPFENKKIAQEWINIIEKETKGQERLKYIYPRLLQWLKNFKRGNLLDIGSGQGKTSAQLKLAGIRYTGVEPSVYLVKRAKELYLKPNIKFLVGNVYKLPVKLASIDRAFSIAVWFHLKNLDAAAKELSRALKKKGRFYIITANPAAYKVWESFFVKAEYVKNKQKIAGKIRVKDSYLSKNIFYLHTLSGIIKSLESQDLKIHSIENFSFTKYDPIRGLWIGIEGYK